MSLHQLKARFMKEAAIFLVHLVSTHQKHPKSWVLERMCSFYILKRLRLNLYPHRDPNLKADIYIKQEGKTKTMCNLVCCTKGQITEEEILRYAWTHSITVISIYNVKLRVNFLDPPLKSDFR